MKRLPSILCYLLLAMSFSGAAMAQSPDRDEQMINASLRFIKEKASLSKKEYQRFARIYSDYNEELAKLNRELKPDDQEYMKRWNSINGSYNGKLEKELEDTTRRKIGMAQWELSQKIFQQWFRQNRREMDAQTQMWMHSAQVNHPFMMMQPQVLDVWRSQMENMEHLSEQQRRWSENFRKYWHLPDTIANDSVSSLIQNRFQDRMPGYLGPMQTPHFMMPYGPMHFSVPRQLPQQGGPAFNRVFHHMPFGGGKPAGNNPAASK